MCSANLHGLIANLMLGQCIGGRSCRIAKVAAMDSLAWLVLAALPTPSIVSASDRLRPNPLPLFALPLHPYLPFPSPPAETRATELPPIYKRCLAWAFQPILLQACVPQCPLSPQVALLVGLLLPYASVIWSFSSAVYGVIFSVLSVSSNHHHHSQPCGCQSCVY